MTNQHDYPAVLTKENFWNELQEKYSVEMKVFCDWIDEYKKRVSWDKLFSNDTNGTNYDGSSILREPLIKFHSIPVAMQIGIFFQFTTEMFNDDRLGNSISLFDTLGLESGPLSMETYIISIQLYFATAHAYNNAGPAVPPTEEDLTGI